MLQVDFVTFGQPWKLFCLFFHFYAKQCPVSSITFNRNEMIIKDSAISFLQLYFTYLLAIERQLLLLLGAAKPSSALSSRIILCLSSLNLCSSSSSTDSSCSSTLEPVTSDNWSLSTTGTSANEITMAAAVGVQAV